MVRATADPLFDTYPDNCTDEEAIMYLLGLEQPGCPLPSNVTKDVDPHSHNPENLPIGIWYLVPNLRENVAIQNGFWIPTGPPCRVVFEPPLSGWRTALEFFEGPDQQKTIWMMHEFKITRDRSRLDVNIKDSSVLCRVLQSSKRHKMPSTVEGVDFSHSSPPKLTIDTENRTEKGSTSAHQEIPPNNPAEDLLDIDCISRGDYLELWDLSFPVSPSSSSENSSCMTISSAECFDSLALLRDLGQENTPDGAEAKDTNCHLSISVSTRPENVVLETTSPSDEKCPTAMDAASSSGHSSKPEGSKKGVGKRMKKLKKKYLCFMPFM